MGAKNFPFVNITVRSSLKVDAVTKLVQSALTKVNPGLAIAVPQTMDAVVAKALGQARLMMWLARNFCGSRFGPRQHRDLRRRRLHGRATNRRDRRPHGARGANTRRPATRREPGNEASGERTRARHYCGVRARPVDRGAALSKFRRTTQRCSAAQQLLFAAISAHAHVCSRRDVPHEVDPIQALRTE